MEVADSHAALVTEGCGVRLAAGRAATDRCPSSAYLIRSEFEDEGDRTVVVDLDVHVGAETAGGDTDPE